MPVSLIRFEDIAPGPPYISAENLQKLQIIADYLQSQNVKFTISLIPRYVDPPSNYDKSILDSFDPTIVAFNSMLQYLQDHGGSFNLEGFTHQFGDSVTGTPEFWYDGCFSNCAPKDTSVACSEQMSFEKSYASSRLRSALAVCQTAGRSINSFVTPSGLAADVERCIISSWIGVYYEDIPGSTSGQITTIDEDEAFFRGITYVPTPLGYVTGADPQGDVNRICQALDNFPAGDIASFYYHPFLEFQFIEISGSSVTYDPNSYLHQLINCFKQRDYNFVALNDVLNFVPSVRQTDFFPGKNNVFFTGDVNGDGKEDFIIWQPETGTWFYVLPAFNPYPNRTNPGPTDGTN